MATTDWTTFTQRININADIQEIYEAWSKPAELERWFLRDADFISPDDSPKDKEQPIAKGDTYRWYWHGWNDNVFEVGTILEANGEDYIKFTFGKAGTVNVAIKEEKGEIICELVQEEIPEGADGKANFYVGCMEGWTFYLTNLKSILEGGIDLRNKNMELENVINS